MEITDEQLKLESMAESILRHTKEQGGSINLMSHLRDVFNDDSKNVERVSRLLTAHGLTTIPYSDNPHNHRITKEGWYFTSFKQERWEVAETKRLEAEQRQSIIDTNESVKETNVSFKKLNDSIIPNNNRLQRNLTIISLVMAGLTTIYIVKDFYKTSSQDLKPIYIQLQRQSQILEKMQQSQKGIDSSLAKAVKDSFYAPLPRHK